MLYTPSINIPARRANTRTWYVYPEKKTTTVRISLIVKISIHYITYVYNTSYSYNHICHVYARSCNPCRPCQPRIGRTDSPARSLMCL